MTYRKTTKPRVYRILYQWACRRLYHELAWAYDPVSWLVSLGRWSSWRRTAQNYLAGSRVLEVGFGTGDLLAELAVDHDQLWGLEPSSAMQRITTGKLARKHVWVPRVQADVRAIPFPDGHFHTIVCTFPGPYILDPLAHGEMARVLRRPAGETVGRMVVVGLRLDLGIPWLNATLQRLFGTPVDEYLVQFLEAAAAAGFVVSSHMEQQGRVGVTVLVAQIKP